MNRRKVILSFLLFISLNVFSQEIDTCKHCKKPINTVITTSDSNSYAWNGNTYYVSGTYYHHTKNMNGSDSITKLNLIIYNTEIISRSEFQEVYKTVKTFKDLSEQRKDSLADCLNPSDEDHSEIDPIKLLNNGKYYALIIGVQDYTDPEISDLDYPINDANKLRDVLVNNYTFSKENVTVLENPDKDKIEEELELLKEKLSLHQNDNVLVFFAGHGFYNEVNKKGYWFASDAKKGSPRSWLSNSDIQDNLVFLSEYARNVLLISDACFSGSILKMRTPFINNSKDIAIKELYYTKTCKAMTSGANEEVDDKSKFLEYLVTYLSNNNKPYLRSRELHTNIEESVIGESQNSQKPQFGVVRESDDKGGDFIFIKETK